MFYLPHFKPYASEKIPDLSSKKCRVSFLERNGAEVFDRKGGGSVEGRRETIPPRLASRDWSGSFPPTLTIKNDSYMDP